MGLTAMVSVWSGEYGAREAASCGRVVANRPNSATGESREVPATDLAAFSNFRREKHEPAMMFFDQRDNERSLSRAFEEGRPTFPCS